MHLKLSNISAVFKDDLSSGLVQYHAQSPCTKLVSQISIQIIVLPCSPHVVLFSTTHICQEFSKEFSPF